MTLQKLLDELSNNEKKVLQALDKHGPSSPEDLVRRAGMKQLVEVMNAAGWLQSKGLVDISESVQVYVHLAKKQYAAKDLPERRILKLLEKEDGIMFVDDIPKHGKVDKGEVSPAVGWLKRKGWANIGKQEGASYVEITEKGKGALKKRGRDEDLIEKLAEGDLKLEDCDADLVKQLKGRKGLIEEKEVVSRTVTMTEKGKEVAALGIEFKALVNLITPELLQSGRWRDVDLRRYDVTSFAPTVHGAKRHPLSIIIEEIKDIFLQMGFTEIKDDFVESAFWNMDTLFIPQDHPAREMQDTMYLEEPKDFDITMTQDDPTFPDRIAAVHKDGGETGSKGWNYVWSSEIASQALLRTHTTVDTVRYLYENPEPPCKVFSVDRVYRKEAIDSTHLPEFYQIEGIVLEKEASFNRLVGFLKEFYARMGFEKIRLRPAYFPYTEPSMEVEVYFNDKWMELGGSGIFRPEVTQPLGVEYPVMAWGLGLERLAMNVLGVRDIRDLYISDLQWLKDSPVFYKR